MIRSQVGCLGYFRLRYINTVKQNLRLVGGFCTLILGAVITVPLPEFGIPLILLGTRLLGDRYQWARTLNAKVDIGWAKVKAWLKKVFRRSIDH